MTIEADAASGADGCENPVLEAWRTRLGTGSLAKEMALLCACIRWPQTGASRLAVARAARDVGDWPHFLGLVRRHRVGGLVAATLGSSTEYVPLNVRKALSEIALQTAQNNLASQVALAAILSAFQESGIDAITLKGLPLAVLAYGKLSVRQSKDIDLLVDRRDFARAADVLRSLGYVRTEPAETVEAGLLDAWDRAGKDHAFMGRGGQVELHWKPVVNDYLLSATWRAAQPQWVSIGHGTNVATPAPEALFAYLCVHGALTGWYRLKWLADIGALLAQCEVSEIETVFDSARRYGAERPAGQALLLCSVLLNTPLPNALLSRLTSDTTIRRLADIALGELVRDGTRERAHVSFGTLFSALSRLMLSNSLRYRLREIAINLHNPTEAILLSFPPKLMLLYPFLRPALWLYRQIGMRDRSDAQDQRRKVGPR